MIDMFAKISTDALIIATHFVCSLYLYSSIAKINYTCKKFSFIIFSGAIITIVCTYLRFCDFSYYILLSFFLTALSFILLERNKLFKSIPLSVLAIGISYSIDILCIILTGTIFYFIGFRDVNFFTELCASIIKFILILLFTKIKRIKNGITIFNTPDNFSIGLLISGPIIVLTTIRKEYISSITLTIIVFGVIISAIGLLFMLKTSITHHYRKRLKLRAEEYSKLELAEKNKEIERLTKENTSLSSIIHLDNHLINKLETTLENFNNDSAINDLITLSKQRNEYVNNKIINEKLLPTTGNDEIDSVISDMYIKAASRRIDFTLNTDCDINYLIHNVIEQADFEKLIRCCITNSIVDIENNPDTCGKILINITQPNDIYEFTIMDNGISKNDNSKSISKIIENSKASIKSTEFDNNDSFTKSLTLRFDSLKQTI